MNGGDLGRSPPDMAQPLEQPACLTAEMNAPFAAVEEGAAAAGSLLTAY